MRVGYSINPSSSSRDPQHTPKSHDAAHTSSAGRLTKTHPTTADSPPPRVMGVMIPHHNSSFSGPESAKKCSPPPREMGVMMPLTTTSRSAPGRLTPWANEPNARALRRTAVGKAAEEGGTGVVDKRWESRGG